ncbi:hypothetical protein GWI33_012602 [Rhynchophorus ferrugineus]|uniref:Uncharacterized protein n=1 Tax=Rhynchophorus ferrugineus TaxID=354439 RepID=A0A834MAR4_RHYFE|nr:hypothetical protein GWI33_012602 [Rhynchophorus ferrugineus]
MVPSDKPSGIAEVNQNDEEASRDQLLPRRLFAYLVLDMGVGGHPRPARYSLMMGTNRVFEDTVNTM